MDEDISFLEKEGLLEKPIEIEIRKSPSSIGKQKKIMADFLRKKLGTSSKMQEYFVEACGEFAPPLVHLTAEFCRQILSGEKKLLSLNEVKHCIDFPKDLEVTAKILWLCVKDDPSIMCYMPNLSDKQIINKQYLVDVMNTVYPDSMKKLC